ncbi:MAG TPA: macro domain-containing protein, partial [Longimicrobiales bacterium]|nr:macro domain-containing protein [Longimicrobiales bacterium]
AAFIIHVVVMSEEEPQSDHTVRRALRNGLSRAADWGLQSLALPPLGLGAGTVEPEDAARGFVEVLLDHLDGGVPPLDLTVVAPSAYEASLLERLVAEATRARSSTRN